VLNQATHIIFGYFDIWRQGIGSMGKAGIATKIKPTVKVSCWLPGLKVNLWHGIFSQYGNMDYHMPLFSFLCMQYPGNSLHTTDSLRAAHNAAWHSACWHIVFITLADVMTVSYSYSNILVNRIPSGHNMFR